MSLLTAGLDGTPIVEKGIEFLKRSQREDGSWPIDTDLNTWVTTLAINGLASGGRLEKLLVKADRVKLRSWIEGLQMTEWHPYTHSPPGGWAWTPLSGGVPDADDTSGALIALKHLKGNRKLLSEAFNGY